MRSLLFTWLLLLAVAATSAAVAAKASAGGGLELTEAGGATYPERAFVIGLPSARHALTPAEVSVTENGGAVADVTLVPAQAAARETFATVLLLDASDSMAGRPIAAALAAARDFAARRGANQQLAVVAFNDTTSTLLPFTTSKAKIDAALASTPRIAYGTHIFDAVAQAESMLADGHVQAGSIVVLSDGADTGSKATAEDVAARARASHVRLFTIGLRDAHFNGSTLVGLARLGGGEYASASSSSALGSLFEQLGARLAREYLLRYKSLVGPDIPVHVSVSVAHAGTASAAYRTPALSVSVPAPYQPSLASRILGSRIAMLLVALLMAGALGLFLIAALQPRRSGLPLRMAEFVSVPGLRAHERHGDPAPSGSAPGLLERIDAQLDIAQVKTPASTLIGGTAVATVLAVLLCALVLGSPWYGLIGFVVPFLVREWVVRKLVRRRLQFAEQLPDSLQVIGAALRAGHSFAGALAVVVERANDPMRSEMQSVVAEEQRGVPLENAIAVVVERMKNRDLEQVALVARLQREAGGNAAEVVDRVAETIRERFELRRLVKTLTVQGRMSRWIVTALPVALVLMLTLLNPHYIHPLVASLFGKFLIVLAAVLVVSGSLVIKRIVDIKV